MTTSPSFLLAATKLLLNAMLRDLAKINSQLEGTSSLLKGQKSVYGGFARDIREDFVVG